MTKRIKVDGLPSLDIATLLIDKEALAVFITDLLRDHRNTRLLLSVLRELADSRGMDNVAPDAHMTPAELAKVLKVGGNPTFDSVRRILAAFGLRLVCQSATYV